jgi:hypothetical protein
MQVNSNVMIGSINIGALGSAALHAERLTGQTAVSSNFIAGQIILVGNQSEIRQLTNITQNNVNGFVTLNLSSSAVIMSQNTINDGNFSFTNQFSSGAIGFGQVSLTANTIAGSGNTLIATGSQPVATLGGPVFNQNLLLGQFNTAFANSSESRISGTNVYHQLVATSLLGNRLIVTGSSNLNDITSFGSAFVGRFNAVDGIRDKSSDIVFAVGTGTGASTRKTGFLIDTGSNSFFEGTVNVSGSLSVNGIPVAAVNTGSFVTTSSFNSFTASAATTGSNSFNGNQRITGSLTISGSIITVDRSGNDGNLYMGQNALGMGFGGAQPLAVGNSISVAIGNGAMRFASGSNQNVAIGNNALLVTTGSKNFAMGSEALSSNTTGQANIGIGTSALQNNTTGESNTAIGDSSAQFSSGSFNTFIGASSGYRVTGSFNTILGTYQGVAGEKIDNNIILSDGQQNVRAQYDGDWQFKDNVNITGSLTIQSGSNFFANGNKQFNVGAFQSNVSQSGSANVSQSMNFEVTDIASGVSIASNSRITLANSGTYNIQFSAQIVAAGGADDIYIWLKKNGTNVSATAGHIQLGNNEEVISSWNYVVDAAASDYYEIAWQAANASTILLTEAASGNIPSVPSVILTVTQVR